MFVVLLCIWTHAKMPWWQFWWDLCLSDFPVTLAIPTTIPTVIPTTVLFPSLFTTSLIPLSIAFSPLFHFFFFWCWLQTFPIHSSRDLRSTEIVPRDPFLLFVEILNLDTVFEEAAKFILLLVLLSVFFVCVAWAFNHPLCWYDLVSHGHATLLRWEKCMKNTPERAAKHFICGAVCRFIGTLRHFTKNLEFEHLSDVLQVFEVRALAADSPDVLWTTDKSSSNEVWKSALGFAMNSHSFYYFCTSSWKFILHSQHTTKVWKHESYLCMHRYIMDWTTIILQESVCGQNMVRNEADCPELTQVCIFTLLFTSDLTHSGLYHNSFHLHQHYCSKQDSVQPKFRLTQQYSDFICTGVIPLI